jgi:hypothetical protein
MIKKDLKNMIVTNMNGRFGYTQELIDMIDEYVTTIFVVDLSREFLEKQGKWNLTRSRGEATVIKEVLPLYTIDTFKKLMNQFGLTHEFPGHHGFLLNHIIQYKNPLPWDLLDFIYEDGLAKGQMYDVNAMLSLVENVENAKWLLSKGAKCCTIPGYGQTFIHLVVSAKILKNTEVLDLIIKEKKVDYDWLTSVDKDGFLNIDSLIILHGAINSIRLFGRLLTDEIIVAAKKEWYKTAKRSCLKELEKIQKELSNLIYFTSVDEE